MLLLLLLCGCQQAGSEMLLKKLMAVSSTKQVQYEQRPDPQL